MARTSNKREQILNFLTQFMNEHGYAPTVREICNAVGLQSTATVHYHLNALRDAGLIETVDNPLMADAAAAVAGQVQL